MSQFPVNNIIDQYQEVNNKLLTTVDPKTLATLGKQLKNLQVKNDLALEILKLEGEISGNKELLKDENDTDLVEMLQDDIDNSTLRIKSLEEDLLTYLAPSDPRDSENILLEIRAGAGGDESSLFAGEILRSYNMMAGELGFNFRIVDCNVGTVGGYKEAIIEVRGDGAYSWYKYEGGVHRVQRVPATEKQGRVHTSTISVAIMPLLEDNSEFKLDLSEVDIIASTSQGAGGQSVNTTYSAIQATHRPTGIKAQCQDERNQQQNKVKALQILTSRVFDHYEQERLAKEIQERRDQVGSADRSEKIRTYNFPQDRVTDHRYNNNWNQLPQIMNGGIYKVIQEIKKLEAKRVIGNL